MNKRKNTHYGKLIGTLAVMGVCALGALALQATEYRDYPCYQLAQAPKLDGQLEPEVWANIPEVGGSYFFQSGERLAERPTWFKVGWTPDAVWLAVHCKEPAMTNVRVAGMEGGTLWNDDSIEIACVPPGGRLQYIVNAAGARWEAKQLPGDGSGWQARVGQNADGWTLEIKIPFNDFGVTPGDRTQWPFTVARYIPSPAAAQPGLGTGAHIVGEFDRLVFRAQQLKPEEAAGIARELAAQKMPVDMTFAAAMQAGVDRYAVEPLTETEKSHPYTSLVASVDFCGARKYFEAVAGLATNEAQQAQALLQVGHCLFAISARVPADNSYSMPHRVFPRSVYEQVVKLADAAPATQAEAQLYVAYCYYNVGEFADTAAIKAASEKALNMPGAGNRAKSEALRMLSDVAVMTQDLASLKVWSEKILDIKEADPGAREQAKIRRAAIDNWERMKNTPRSAFNREYAKEALDPAATNVLPAIGWAKPGRGAPLQVLAMCYANGVREVAQLAQRMDIEPTLVTTVDRREFGEKSAESYANGAVGFAVAAAQKQQKIFEDALDRTNDVMILAEINWSGMPLPVREKILKKVADGTPLIIKTAQPDELFKAATTNRIPTGLESVYPYKGLPAFAGYPDKKAWQDGVIERYRHGKGDIWVLKGYETPDYQILTPGAVGMAGDLKLVEYDYYLALMIHLICEAGGVKMPVRVKGKESWEMAREAMQPLVLLLASEMQTNVTCIWTVRDRDNRIAAVKQEPLVLKAGENEVKYDLGKVSGGEYFVDLQVKDGNKVLDFGSAYVTVTSANCIASVEVGKEIGKKDKVKGKVRLVLAGAKEGPVPPARRSPDQDKGGSKVEGLTVQIQRRDNYRRVVGETQAKVTGAEIAFVLPAAEPLTAVQAVDVELKRGEEVLDRRSVSFRIKDFVEADRHAVLPKDAGAGSYLAEYLAAGYERAGVGRVLNNLVTELLNVAEFPGAGMDEFSFENPRAGWIYVAGEVEQPVKDGEAWVWVGTAADSRTMLEWGRGETNRHQETMRYLEPGKYRVLAGTLGKACFNRLIVRTVPEICLDYPAQASVAGVRAKVDWEYLKKHILNSVNVIQYPCFSRGGVSMAPPLKEITEWKRRGGKWFAYSSVPAFSSTSAPTVEEVYRFWTSEDLPMAYVDGLVCDEFTGAHLPIAQEKFEVYVQGIRQISETPAYRGKTIYPWIGLGNARFFRSVLRQIAESGNRLLLERYLAESATRDENVRYLTIGFDLELEPFWEVLPQPQKHFLQVPCPGIMMTGFNCDAYPNANFKVFLDMLYNYLANAPAMAGLYGLDLYDFYGTDEETTRWLGKLFRHYFIEGRRNLLSTDPYELKHIKNADFADGLKEWQTAAADTDSIKAFACPGLARIENRQYLGELRGADECVSMRRSAKAPNRLIQTIAHLEKGRLYSVAFYTYDAKKNETEKHHVVTVNIDRGEILRPLPPQTVKNDLNWHFLVFRAQADSAVLTISDWKEPSAPGGPIGQELLYDFVQVQPYDAESPDKEP